MPSEVTRKVHNIMAREMGHLGKFIVTKQCKNLGINEDNIKSTDLARLAKALGEVMTTFGGKDKANKIKNEIKRIGQL